MRALAERVKEGRMTCEGGEQSTWKVLNISTCAISGSAGDIPLDVLIKRNRERMMRKARAGL